MKLKKLIKHILSEHPSSFQQDNIRFLRRHNGDYLVAPIDYDDQAMMVDGKMAAVFCKCTGKELKKALEQLTNMEKT